MSQFKTLLSNMGFGFISAESLNLQLASSLEDALKKDHKSALVTSDNEVSINFDTPITSTEDLFRNDFMVIRCVLESWCLSVTSELLKEINKDISDNPVYISLNGGLYDAYLTFENTDDYLVELQTLGFGKVSKIYDTLTDWLKTVDFINGGSDFYDEVTIIKNDKFNDD